MLTDDEIRPHYEQVDMVDVLPHQWRNDRGRLEHGYVVSLGRSHSGGNLLTFFRHLEPALVFGRAGRSSGDFGEYGVREAAREIRCDPEGGRDIWSLHVLRHSSLDRQPGEEIQLRRWIEGVNLASAYWSPR